MKSIFIALFLVACGGKQTPAPVGDNTKPAVGNEGAVCAIGRQHQGSAVAVECGPGFNCCYPCGIDGCDSVCMAGDCPTDIP